MAVGTFGNTPEGAATPIVRRWSLAFASPQAHPDRMDDLTSLQPSEFPHDTLVYVPGYGETTVGRVVVVG